MNTRHELMLILEKKYPKMFLRTTEEFNGNKDGIWTSGEDHVAAKDGQPLFDYDSEGTKYDLGVHQEMTSLLNKAGWWAEWYDAGTVMLWPE